MCHSFYVREKEPDDPVGIDRTSGTEVGEGVEGWTTGRKDTGEFTPPGSEGSATTR